MSVSAVLVLLFFCAPVAANPGPGAQEGAEKLGETGPPHALAGDYVIDKSGPFLCPFSWDGNVFVKSGVTAILTDCDFTIIQHPGDDYNLMIEDGARLSISAGSEIKTSPGFALDVIGAGAAALDLTTSKLLLGKGTISGSFGSTIQVQDSEIVASSVITNARVDVARSTLSIGAVALQVDSSWDAVTLKGSLEVTSGSADLGDTTFQGLKVSGSGVARIYRWLEVSVADGLSVPVLDAIVEPVNRDDPLIQAVAEPLGNGRWNVPLMSDIVNSSDPYGRYVGNWFVKVTMGTGGGAPAKRDLVLSLPPFSEKDQPFTRSQPVDFREVQMPSTSADYYVVKDNDDTIGSAFGSKAPMLIKGNIRVTSGRTLTIGPDAHIRFPDDAPGRSIVVENGATLRLNGSTVEGNLALYVEAGGKVVGRGLVSDGGLGALGGDVDATDLEFRGGLGGTFGTFKVQRLKVGGQSNASAGEFNLTSATFGDDVTLDTAKLVIDGMQVNGHLRFDGYAGDLEAGSLTYKSVSLEEGVTLKRNWKLKVEVVNGGDRLVKGANVTLERIHPSGSPTGAPEATGWDGVATLSALGEIVTRDKSEYVGNYRIRVVYDAKDEQYVLEPAGTIGLDADKEVKVRFADDFVPPISMSTKPLVDRPEYEPGAAVSVDGTLIYNGGPDPVVGAEVTLTLVEVGIAGTKIGTKLTDSIGGYHFTFNAPPVEGTYTLRIDAVDNTTNLSVSQTRTFAVKRGETLQLTVLLFAVVIVAAIVSLWAVSRYRKWQEFRRDARDNPLFKSERHFDEVERQLRTELARELHGRPTRPEGPTLLSGETGENGRGKRKRGGGLLGTDGGSDARSRPNAAKGKVSSPSNSLIGMVRRP